MADKKRNDPCSALSAVVQPIQKNTQDCPDANDAENEWPS